MINFSEIYPWALEAKGELGKELTESQKRIMQHVTDANEDELFLNNSEAVANLMIDYINLRFTQIEAISNGLGTQNCRYWAKILQMLPLNATS